MWKAELGFFFFFWVLNSVSGDIAMKALVVFGFSILSTLMCIR